MILPPLYEIIFEGQCWWIFNHDWEDTSEPAHVLSKEQYYWVVQKCKKCKAKREVMTV